MGLALFCFIACGFIVWGMLAKFGSKVHERLVEPLCIRYAEEGTKSIPKFLIVGLIFNSLYKGLSRIPIWIILYYCITYFNVSGARAFGFIGLCILVEGFKRTVMDVQRHFSPPYNYKDNYNHSYRDSW